MKVFFGKISNKVNPEQYRNGFYETDSPTMFNGIEIGDYCFLIANGKIQLWKAREWRNDNKRLDFDILIKDTKLNTKKLTALKFFKIKKDFVVITVRSAVNAFFEIGLTGDISPSQLIDESTYQKEDNFRKIIIYDNQEACQNNSTDVQLYLRNDLIHIFKADFIEADAFNNFYDNRDKIGKGRKNKDSTLKKFQAINYFPHTFSASEVSLLNLYDAFAVKYDEKSIIEEMDGELSVEYLEREKMSKPAPLNQILYGPPGTGKTYHTINEAIKIIDPDFDLSQNRRKVKEKFDELHQSGRIVFTTFHQSMSYEDFVEGIKPLKPEDGDTFVKYEVRPGIFKTICEKAKSKSIISNNFENAYASLLREIKDNQGALVLESLVHAKEFTIYENSKGNLKFHANTEKAYEGVIRKEIIQEFLISGNALDWPSYTKAVAKHLVTKHKYSQIEKEDVKPYVLIIDEINRGNVSQIFGELITLLETDKRMGNDEALEVTLPYSKDTFSVPPNLYLIGTMNTADRSVESLDTALRRRFSFVEMPPKTDLEELQRKIGDIWLPELLETLNRRIEKLLDKDHLLGHSYFLKVKDMPDLQATFYRNIIPLLQEYFFGDFGKIGLVLGAGFVTMEESGGDLADFSAYTDLAELDERRIFRIKKESEMQGRDFESALNILLKKQQ